MTVRVGLVGARGYVGREMLALLHRHPRTEVAFASSREWAGQRARDVLDLSAGTLPDDLHFEALSPREAAVRKADVVILGLPNNKAAPFVAAIDEAAPETTIIDLSADYRHDPSWVYGLPERHREALRGARRIANPGCYATAAQLAALPLAAHWDGPVHVFGLSGYSGAGTTPSRRNDPAALADNAMPYGLVGHGHEREIASQTGLDIRFTPAVAGYFRGLVTVVSGTLCAPLSPEEAAALFEGAYDREPFVRLQDSPAEPADAASSPFALVSRPVVSDDGLRCVVTASLDNLLKGAASQALQNLNLALGLNETLGLTA